MTDMHITRLQNMFSKNNGRQNMPCHISACHYTTHNFHHKRRTLRSMHFKSTSLPNLYISFALLQIHIYCFKFNEKWTEIDYFVTCLFVLTTKKFKIKLYILRTSISYFIWTTWHDEPFMRNYNENAIWACALLRTGPYQYVEEWR
jgi:hypothetical protein